MKVFLGVFILFMAISGCTEKEEKPQINKFPELPSLTVPDISVNFDLLSFDRKVSIWNLEGKPFSGYAEKKYSNGNLKNRFGILDGKMQNAAIEWYSDGAIKDSANYYQGKLHGEKKAWIPDSSHLLIAHLNYYKGKVHGKQKKWYPTGELFQELNLEMGQEKGIQKAYRKNGVLYVNYEAKNGRIFGMKKAALCFQLEDQKIKKDEE